MWKIKPDRRYRVGHIKYTKDELRGHPDSVNMDYYELPPLTKETATIMHIDAMKYALAPPLIITREMADAIKQSKEKQQ